MRRTIECLSIRDDQPVWAFEDHGVDRDGVPTNRRQQLMRVLSKKCKETGLPTFRVVKVGAWRLQPGESMPGGDDFAMFDAQWLEGKAPDARWLDERKRIVGKRAERADEAARDMQRRMSAEVGEGIVALTKQLAAQQAAQAAPAVAKGGAR